MAAGCGCSGEGQTSASKSISQLQLPSALDRPSPHRLGCALFLPMLTCRPRTALGQSSERRRGKDAPAAAAAAATGRGRAARVRQRRRMRLSHLLHSLHALTCRHNLHTRGDRSRNELCRMGWSDGRQRNGSAVRCGSAATAAAVAAPPALHPSSFPFPSIRSSHV